MAGRVRQLIDELYELRARGRPGVDHFLKAHLILQGINPDLHTAKTYDDPEMISALEKMIQAARSAPSFQNRQCWNYVFVRDKKLINDLAVRSGLIGKVNFFIKDAPLVVAACADTTRSGTINKQDYYLVDVAISFQQMMLMAWSMGIGSCWLAAFNEPAVKKILDIPEKIRIVAISPFGYPKEKVRLYSKVLKTFAGSGKRMPQSKNFFFEKWGGSRS